jgi:GDP-4-dehydro-6-deoxy-D-mannose reductase
LRHVLVTGAGGFVGRRIVAALSARGDRVTACGRNYVRPETLPTVVEWLSIDLLDRDSVAALELSYSAVVHLAAETVPAKFKTSEPVLDNLAMLLNLTDRLASGRLLYVSSCHVYGPQNAPCHEDDPVKPQGRYGLSKQLCEQAALAAHHLDVRIARPFNHLGVGMPAELAAPSIIRRVRVGGEEPLLMHGMDSIRDFLDIEDIVNAYIALIDLESSSNRVFNICSGIPVTIGELAYAMLAAAGDDRAVIFEQRAISSDDTPCLIGDNSRLTAATEWQQRVPLAVSVQRMLHAG